jgi:glutaredoxin-related protein
MAKIILYSTNCPKCNVLEKKLQSKNINFEICNNVDLMLSKGIQQAPYLEVDNELMDFSKAVKWVNEK